MNGITQPRTAWSARKKIANCVAWNSECEASGNHGSGADHRTTAVRERAAGVARGKPHTGLHPALRTKGAQRADGVDHSGCQSTHKSEGIAYGNGELARAQLRRIRRAGRGQ